MRRLLAMGAAVGAMAALGCGPRPGAPPAGSDLSTRRGPLTWGPTPDGVDTPVVGVSPRAIVPRGTFNGRELAVTWEDFRGLGLTRLSEDGVLRDDANFRIAAGDNIRTPDVASDGQSFFAVWAEVGSPSRVRGALITVAPDGDLVAGDPITIAVQDVSELSRSPRVVFGGGNYGVVWFEDGYPKWRVMFARVSSTGALVDPVPVVVSDTGYPLASIQYTESAPDILWDGGGFVVGWRELNQTFDTTISVRRIGPGLTLSSRHDAVFAKLPAVTGGTALAFDGSQVWIAWEQFAGGTATQAQVMIRRTHGDAWIDAAPLAVQTTDHFSETQPALVFEASRGTMALAHADSLSHQITFQRLALDTAAPLLAPVPIVSTGDTDQVHPLLLRGAGTTLVAWETASAVYGTRLRDSATPLDAPPLVISRSLNPEVTPMVAGGDSGFAVIWRDQRLGGFRLFGTTLSPDGAPLLQTATPLITDPISVGANAVGWGGGQYLVVGVAAGPGVTSFPLRGRLFGPDGAPRSAVITVSMQPQSENRVAYAGGTFLVVGQGTAPMTGKSQVLGTRVSSAGAGLGTTIIDGTSGAYTVMGLASDGSRFLVAWSAASAISGRLVRTDGTLVGTAALPLASSPGGSLFEPAAAFGGGVYLVVWHDLANRRIAGELVSVDGAVLAPGAFPISAPAGGEHDAYPGVAFDGVRFVVGWKSMTVPEGGLAQAHEIRWAPVTPAGVVGATSLAALDDGSDQLTDPVVLAGGTNGRAVIAYTQADSPAGYAIARTRVRLLRTTPGGAGGGCHDDGDCAAGSCVDGVCCATACAGGGIDCQACSIVAGAATNGTCAPVPDGRACGAHGACAAGACQERDAGTAPVDGGSDVIAEGGVDGPVDALLDRSPDEPSDDAQDAGTPAEPTPDAAPRDAAADLGAERSGTTGGGGCSCRVGSDQAPSSWLGWPLLVGVALRRTRRRRPAAGGNALIPAPPSSPGRASSAATRRQRRSPSS